MKIGILTSGGDCAGLNAVMRAIGLYIYRNIKNAEIVGFQNGYVGLIKGECKPLRKEDFEGLLDAGGTMLGTNRTPFKQMTVPEEDGITRLDKMCANYKKLGLDCLFTLGGAGTHRTAALLCAEGYNVIGLPKTIDNDLYGTDMTFGFQSAVDIATNAIDCIHTTAASHNRVFIVEVMGHKVGWLTLYAGVASGADIILLPEIPYDINKVVEAIEKRNKQGKGFTILAVAEGAISKEDAKLSKKELKKKRENSKHPTVSYELAEEITRLTGSEARVTVPGHTQRGGSPCPYDRVLCTRLGAAAAMAIMDKDYGNMIAMRNGETVRVPLEEVAGKLKMVDPNCQMIKEVKLMGISFGD